MNDPAQTLRFPFDNSYRRLPDVFHGTASPAPCPKPQLIHFNRPLAEELGLPTDGLDADALAQIFSGQQLPEGAQPLAMAYAGHQFGNFVPKLGDGRALLLGEVIDHLQQRRDIQLKGAGRTPFSRGGDGLSPLGPVLREYLVSEAMHALGVPTTRALAAVATGDTVLREEAEPGAILTRVARSHIRVGTFEYFRGRNDHDNLRVLADYALERLFPDLLDNDSPYRALLERVIDRQVSLISHWMSLGFIHGVMNTDNMALSGETIDYGPCAFMNAYDPQTVYSYIDQGGRYAYGNQPDIGLWNLTRFAECLLPLLHDDEDEAVAIAKESLSAYPRRYRAQWLRAMGQKLGLEQAQGESDLDLVRDLLALMETHGVDFTQGFRLLGPCAEASSQHTPLDGHFGQDPQWRPWVERWQQRLDHETQSRQEIARAMARTNPLVIPRNHLINRALEQARADNFAPFHRLLDVLTRPFDPALEGCKEAQPPGPQEDIRNTFCGT